MLVILLLHIHLPHTLNFREARGQWIGKRDPQINDQANRPTCVEIQLQLWEHCYFNFLLLSKQLGNIAG